MEFDDIDETALRARRGKKWSAHDADVLPAWVADMDFLPARPIRESLARMAETGDLGYGEAPATDPLREVFAERCARRYHWPVAAERVELISDVVQGLYLALDAFTQPGEGAVVFTPIYPPFLQAVRETGRRAVLQPLVRGPAGFAMDLDALAAAVDQDTRLLMLCSPHNPSGRAWRRDELEALAGLALERDLLVVSDEIHADLVLDGQPHIPFASLSPEVAERTLTLMSASKAFNIAGLRCAVAVPGGDVMRRLWKRAPRHLRGAVSTPGSRATRVAWSECDDWLEAAVDHLRGNRELLGEWLTEHLPEIDYRPPEATYLAWLDCRALQLPEPPGRYFLRHARVALSEGAEFGAPGEGHVRLNFATSRPILKRILERMEVALHSRNTVAGEVPGT